jgi:GNAT superfamily N-acetyltransferase
VIEVVQEHPPDIAAYAKISIAFPVVEVARIPDVPARATQLTAERVATPYLKDYDALGNGPLSWRSRFDLTHWTFFAAYVNGERAGGAVVVYGAPDVDMLERRSDVALLWDIRVAPAHRGTGVGSALLEQVEAWARENDAQWIEVETQDINVPACRFYARHGFELRVVNPDAYAELPNETQLLWYKRLAR